MKPSIPQGTRDFSPAEVRQRQYIFDTLRSIFELYGFQPLETPAMEQLTTLMGKYGEEGDRLIFKILNNGLHESKQKETLQKEWNALLERPYNTAVITERALRYDLTIPFARYVVMHQNEIAFPFRRYQMQPVWRADRPQRGRYREFWQCDCDVVGSTSLLSEAELLCIYQTAFQKLEIPDVSVKINNRKLLAALAEYAGHPKDLVPITVALDKLDKIGVAGVINDLESRGISAYCISCVEEWIAIDRIQAPIEAKLSIVADFLGSSNIGVQGILELREVLNYHAQLANENTGPKVILDLTLARGLNYYTGVIMEVTTSAVKMKMGSIGGGGRYDDLTGLFGVKGLSGVGVSFGIDRMYDVMEELNLFPETLAAGARVMLLNFGGEDEAYAIRILQNLRRSGISAELYPEAAKFDKQMKYANKRAVPYIILAGESERTVGKLSLKNMTTGKQETVSLDEAITALNG